MVPKGCPLLQPPGTVHEGSTQKSPRSAAFASKLPGVQLARNVPQPNMQQGREDFAHNLVKIESVEGPAARMEVLDHRSRRPYQVALWLNGNQIAMTCTCREGYYWYACRHRVAAFMGLREHLKKHPPKIWKAVLDQGRHATTRRTAPDYSPVAFSLQNRGGSWVIVPYTLDANDMRFAIQAGFTSGSQFFDYLKDSFDVLYEEGRRGAPKMMSVGLHCRLVGRPGRAAALARFVDYVAGHEQVWVCRRDEIARHWHEQFTP